MSERQAKKQRKTQTEVKNHGQAEKRASLFNVILVLVVVAVLALGVVAVIRAYEPRTPQSDDAQQTQTVAEYAETVGMTAEEFLSEYGLDASETVTADTDINTASGEMTIENYAKFTEVSVDELKETYGFGEAVTDDMTWYDAQAYMPIGIMCEMSGLDYEQLLASYNLTEEQLPRDTIQSEAMVILQDAMAAQQESEENTDDNTDTDTDTDTDAEASSDDAQPDAE